VTNKGLYSGGRTNPQGRAIRNRILLGIPDDEYRSVREQLEFLDLPHHYSLHEPVRKIRFAYFLNCGLASLVVTMRGGKNVEAGVVGCEGFVGAPLLGGLERSPLREQMQIAGAGFRITCGALQTALAECPTLRMNLTRYTILLGLQIAQTAACNRLHPVQQRLARWLLLAHDRLNTETVPITHDFLAVMLGTDRPSVSLAAANLQRKKTIAYQRGVLKVLHRKRLQSVACECYEVIHRFDGELDLR
jgi:CRP-like cAMP-binding protein